MCRPLSGQPLQTLSGRDRAERLLSSLRQARVPQAAFFVNSVRLHGERRTRILKYAHAGHLIANHTHTHPELNVTDDKTYVRDIKTADAWLRSLPGFTRWFRFPYLREGETQEKRDEVRITLNRLGYANAYITINNYDWYMDVLYQQAVREGRDIDYQALERVYVQVLADSVEYYDQMAHDVLGRSPKHVLLLHENDLAAFFVRPLVEHLRSLGWTIISPRDAYQDGCSTYLTAAALPSNPGRIGEIARDRGWCGPLWHHACGEVI